MGWRKSVAACVVVTVGLVGACGGSDEPDAAGEPTTTTTTTGSSGAVSTFGDIPGVSDECTAIANLSIALTQAVSGTLGEVAGDILDAIPADARADGQIILDALEEFGARLAEDGIDLTQGGLAGLTPEQLETYVNASADIFNEDVEAAADRFSQYAVTCAPGG